MPDHTVAPPAKHEQSSWCLLHKHLPAQNSSLSLKDGMFRSPYAKQQQWTLQHEGKSWSIARQGIWVSRGQDLADDENLKFKFTPLPILLAGRVEKVHK